MNLAKLRIRREADCPLAEMDNLPEAMQGTTAKLRIRLLTPGELRSVGEAQFDMTMENQDGALVQKTHHRPAASRERLFDLAVIGWSGVWEDEAGTVPVPYGQAGKRAIVDACPAVLEFVDQCYSALQNQVDAQETAQEKN